jgi:D-alanine-D-alanine ligase
MTGSAAANAKEKRIAIAYTELLPDAREEQQDILNDVGLISRALTEAGYSCMPIPVNLDLAALLARIRQVDPMVVFNMVEALVDHDRLIHLAPAVFEAFRVPYTGAGARGHFLTTDKALAKEMLRLAGVPTPAWQRCDAVAHDGVRAPLPCIIKPVLFDASRDIDEHSVCVDAAAVMDRVNRLKPEMRGEYLAEEYIDGREFNISALAFDGGVRVLPAAEMTFVDYPPGKPAIVDYKAKWERGSFEYTHTVRKFDCAPSDAPLIEELKRLTLRCWSLFGLCGYARTDFRVDKAGRPWVLEVNANPCISPDSGFVAAGEKAGFSYAQLIIAIVDDALRRAAHSRVQ